MKIAIIGAGNVGGALAHAWIQRGHKIFIGARDLNSKKVVQTLEWNEKIIALPIVEAVSMSDVVLVATPVSALVGLAKDFPDMQDKVIIDATNALWQKPEPYQNGVEVFKQLTNTKDVVKCFNSTGFENMSNTDYNGVACDMFVAGDSEKGKQVAIQLAKDAGFEECYDFGGDGQVALLEQFALAWINLAIIQQNGRNIAFKLLKR